MVPRDCQLKCDKLDVVQYKAVFGKKLVGLHMIPVSETIPTTPLIPACWRGKKKQKRELKN